MPPLRRRQRRWRWRLACPPRPRVYHMARLAGGGFDLALPRWPDGARGVCGRWGDGWHACASAAPPRGPVCAARCGSVPPGCAAAASVGFIGADAARHQPCELPTMAPSDIIGFQPRAAM